MGALLSKLELCSCLVIGGVSEREIGKGVWIL